MGVPSYGGWRRGSHTLLRLTPEGLQNVVPKRPERGHIYHGSDRLSSQTYLQVIPEKVSEDATWLQGQDARVQYPLR